MAAKKKKSMTPAVRHLRYQATVVNGGSYSSYYIDLARDLSAVNRRLYRQGRDYHVKRITIVSRDSLAARIALGSPTSPDIPVQTDAGKVRVSTVPNSWVARNAWNRGFNLWNKANKEAMKAVGSDIKGTWSDFKVYMSNGHRTGTTLDTLDLDNNPASYGDWEYSVLVSPDGTTSADPFYLQWVGNHNGSVGAWNAVGLIKSYGESRATVNVGSPNVPSTVTSDPLANMFDDGTITDERLGLLKDENDVSPYETASYPGDDTNMPTESLVQVTTLGTDGKATVGGFSALGGLIRLDVIFDRGDDDFDILVELAPGNYRGIAAEVIM
jgi:hypothetical protein